VVAAEKAAKDAARARIQRARERVLARRVAERDERLRQLAEDKARDEEKAAAARIAAMVGWACCVAGRIGRGGVSRWLVSARDRRVARGARVARVCGAWQCVYVCMCG
jgi:hypothetical protein